MSAPTSVHLKERTPQYTQDSSYPPPIMPLLKKEDSLQEAKMSDDKFSITSKPIQNVEQKTEQAFHSTIPVLDMGEFYNLTTKNQFVNKLSHALMTSGFFAIVNTGINIQILDNAYDLIVEFFKLERRIKESIYNPKNSGQRGYIPGESAKGELQKDCKEFLHVGRELNEDQQERLGFCPNLWPKEIELKAPLCALFKQLESLGKPIQESMALAIGKPEDFFKEMTKEGDLLLRAIHYPKDPPKDGSWAAEHTDIDLFTILPRATAEGLEVKNEKGEWISVIVPEGAVIVNAGDMLENITNGRFKSALHRVKDRGNHEDRYSAVFFVHPRSTDDMSPLPSCVQIKAGKVMYPKATRWQLLQVRLVELGLASDQMMKELADSRFIEDQLIPLGRASTKLLGKMCDKLLASKEMEDELIRLQ